MTSGPDYEGLNESLLTEIAVAADEDWDDLFTMLEPVNPKDGVELHEYLTMLSKRIKTMSRKFNTVRRLYLPDTKEYYYTVQNYTYDVFKYLRSHYPVAVTYLNIGVYEKDLSERDRKSFKEKAREN